MYQMRKPGGDLARRERFAKSLEGNGVVSSYSKVRGRRREM